MKGRQLGFKDGGVLKSQTNPGERGWLSVWFAFGALILRRLAYSTERRETKKTDLGTHWGGLSEGADECQVKALMFRGKPFYFSRSQSAGLRLWEFQGISCDGGALSEECFVRSQGAPHIRGIRLAPVR